MYVPYGGDIRHMDEITRKSGQNVAKLVSKTLNFMRSLRIPAESIQARARKWKWNAS